MESHDQDHDNTYTAKGMNLIHFNQPKSLRYITYEQRLESFATWPSNFCPEQLAKAGLFYAKQRDCVRCFFCGIGLMKWTDADDAWEEHAGFSPDCLFIQLNPGKSVWEQQPKEETSDKLLCKICLERESDVILLPCAHISVCSICICSSLSNQCPICRKTVLSLTKVFIS